MTSTKIRVTILVMPFRLDKFKIDSHEFFGSRLRVDGYLSRTGIQIYDRGNGTMAREQRDASEVFSKDSLASMRGMPVTIDHPPMKMVDEKNWRGLTYGHVGDDVGKAADGVHTKASIWVLDGLAQQQIIDGRLVELSIGYYAELDETPGINSRGERYDARQVNIRGNHLALLETNQARGGRDCRLRLDSEGNARYENDEAPPIADTTMMRSKPNRVLSSSHSRKRDQKMTVKLKVRADGYDHEVEAESDSLIVALEKERAKKKEIIDSMTNELDRLKAKLDTELAKTAELEEKLRVATDPDAITKAVEERTQLKKDAFVIAGKDIECSGDSLAIKRATLNAIGVKLDDKSDAYIEACFDARLEIASTEDSARRFKGARQIDDSDDSDFSFSVSEILSDRLKGGE